MGVGSVVLPLSVNGCKANTLSRQGLYPAMNCRCEVFMYIELTHCKVCTTSLPCPHCVVQWGTTCSETIPLKPPGNAVSLYTVVTMGTGVQVSLRSITIGVPLYCQEYCNCNTAETFYKLVEIQ